MPFGGESTWDLVVVYKPFKKPDVSPMPFGGESTWDEILYPFKC